MIEMEKVKSSNLSEVGYDEEEETLVVQFKNGSKYTYDDVPVSEYHALMGAPSVGKYFNTNIAKGGYSYKRS